MRKALFLIPAICVSFLLVSQGAIAPSAPTPGDLNLVSELAEQPDGSCKGSFYASYTYLATDYPFAIRFELGPDCVLSVSGGDVNNAQSFVSTAGATGLGLSTILTPTGMFSYNTTTTMGPRIGSTCADVYYSSNSSTDPNAARTTTEGSLPLSSSSCITASSTRFFYASTEETLDRHNYWITTNSYTSPYNANCGFGKIGEEPHPGIQSQICGFFGSSVGTGPLDFDYQPLGDLLPGTTLPISDWH